ncbi:hypothetical protein ACFXO9_18590 [Nocardia tengchongensis]|uniref:hypothetical protein n=1 Tax=Nocardia tengchongensis TaxID=2055889 RepID=UPI00369D4FDE
MVITPSHGAIDINWLADEIEAIHLEPDPESGRLYQRDSYNLTATRRHFSWGADAQTFQFLIETMASFGHDALLVGGTLALERGWEKLYEQLKSRGHDVRYGRVKTLSDDEAQNQGLWLITGNYQVAYEDLVAKSVGNNIENQTYSVSAAGPDGSLYSVVFTMRGSAELVESRKDNP